VGSRRIALGRQVVAVVATAMMDGRRVAAPRQFRVERPAMDVLHFGTGLHRCFGEPIARVQMAAIAAALLRRGEPRRARSGGRLDWDGPFPARLGVEFSGRG
jgi:cytochrome P450